MKTVKWPSDSWDWGAIASSHLAALKLARVELLFAKIRGYEPENDPVIHAALDVR